MSGASAATTGGSAQNGTDIATLQANLQQAQDDLDAAEAQIATLMDSTAFNLTDDDERRLRNDYAILTQVNTEHEAAAQSYGIQMTATSHAGMVNRPSCVKKDGDNILVSQYYHRPLIANPDGWGVVEQFPVTYQNPSSGNEGIAYSYGVGIDRSNNRIAICSWARHIVRVYTLDTYELLYTVGIPSAAGNHSAGKLYYPATAEFDATTGNLYIVSYYGYGDGCTNHGHISEYNGATGAFISTRQGFKGTGQPEGGYLYRPIDMFIDGQYMWVSVYGRNKLAKLDMSTTDADGFWPVVDYILPPANQSLTNPWGICACSDGDIAVIVLAKKEIIKINPTTKAVTEKISLIEAGLPGDARRIVELEPGIFAYTDWSALGICVVPISGEISAQYATSALQSGWEHDHTEEGFNPDTGVLTKPWNTAVSFPSTIKQCMRKV